MDIIGVYLLIALILTFTYVNGFHDGCNVVATIIASRSMGPKKALLWASVFEFIGAAFLGTAVAVTIGKGIIDPSVLSHNSNVALFMVFSAISCALVWNIITWLVAIPSSSSHALIGGIIGSGIGAYGFHVINWHIFLYKVLLIMFLTPIIGMIVGYFLTKITFALLANCSPSINKFIKRIQFLSMCFLGASHGTNDAQKSMGLITMVLATSGIIDSFYVSKWVIFSCAIAISLGVLSGGWRLIKTIGFRIFRLEPIHSFNAQLAAGTIIYVSGLLGGPVSTSQIMSSSIMGVGAAHRFKQVRWEVAKDIFMAWFITIPIVCVGAMVTYWLLAHFSGMEQTSFNSFINYIKNVYGLVHGTIQIK